MSLERRRQMIEPGHPRLSIVRQCDLVAISRSGFYRPPVAETALNLALMRLIDAQFLETPWCGSRQMARHLRRDGHAADRKEMCRLTASASGPVRAHSQSPDVPPPGPVHRLPCRHAHLSYHRAPAFSIGANDVG